MVIAKLGVWSPLPSHPPSFLRLLPGHPRSALGLTLFSSWKVWHMENNTQRPKETISLASVANGLDNMGTELLESLVCPLPQPHLGPLVGRAFVHHLPSPPSSVLASSSCAPITSCAKALPPPRPTPEVPVGTLVAARASPILGPSSSSHLGWQRHCGHSLVALGGRPDPRQRLEPCRGQEQFKQSQPGAFLRKVSGLQEGTWAS